MVIPHLGEEAQSSSSVSDTSISTLVRLLYKVDSEKLLLFCSVVCKLQQLNSEDTVIASKEAHSACFDCTGQFHSMSWAKASPLLLSIQLNSLYLSVFLCIYIRYYKKRKILICF